MDNDQPSGSKNDGGRCGPRRSIHDLMFNHKQGIMHGPHGKNCTHGMKKKPTMTLFCGKDWNAMIFLEGTSSCDSDSEDEEDLLTSQFQSEPSAPTLREILEPEDKSKTHGNNMQSFLNLAKSSGKSSAFTQSISNEYSMRFIRTEMDYATFMATSYCELARTHSKKKTISPIAPSKISLSYTEDEIKNVIKSLNPLHLGKIYQTLRPFEVSEASVMRLNEKVGRCLFILTKTERYLNVLRSFEKDPFGTSYKRPLELFFESSTFTSEGESSSSRKSLQPQMGKSRPDLTILKNSVENDETRVNAWPAKNEKRILSLNANKAPVILTVSDNDENANGHTNVINKRGQCFRKPVKEVSPLDGMEGLILNAIQERIKEIKKDDEII